MRSCVILTEDYAFSVWELLSVGLTGYSTCWNESFGFPEKAHNRGFPANPTIYTHHLLWMKTGLWCSWQWFILLAQGCLPLHIILQNVLFIIITIYFKNRTFLLTYRERIIFRNTVKKIFFSQLRWKPNKKWLRYPRWLQILFKAWFGYFKWAISRVYNVDYSQLMSWFDH